MAKKPKQKKLGVKALLSLMGCDPNEAVPTGLKEAEWHRSMEGDEPEPVGLGRCSTAGKVCFTSESQAKTAAKRRLKKGSNAAAFRAYVCPDCSKWHLSSQMKRS